MSVDLFNFKFGKPQSVKSDFVAPVRETALVLHDETFDKLRDVIYKLCGIYFNESKKYLLEGRIAKRLSSLNMSSYEEYVSFIKSFEGRKELNKLFEAVTINETYFFRSPQQFEAFEEVIFPEIIAKRKESRPIFKIWSAASSTGEEAYTLAIIILEKLRYRYPNVQFQIIASDINNAVLETARNGIFKEYSIRHIPPAYLVKYFKKVGNTFVLSDEVKKMVTFQSMNLYDPVQMASIINCDLVFCCNVLIYFDLPSKQQVVSSIFKSLNPGGYLMIGYSESLHGITNAFKLIHLPKAMAYKKD